MESVRIDRTNLTNLKYAKLEGHKNNDRRTPRSLFGCRITEINFSKTKYITNLGPSRNIKFDRGDLDLVNKYVYLGHEIRMSRDNQTAQLNRIINIA